jgi:hypothetical protein
MNNTGYYSTEKRKKIIKDFMQDIDEINYMLKQVDLINLDDADLHELYSKSSKIWLILSKIYT